MSKLLPVVMARKEGAMSPKQLFAKMWASHKAQEQRKKDQRKRKNMQRKKAQMNWKQKLELEKAIDAKEKDRFSRHFRDLFLQIEVR